MLQLERLQTFVALGDFLRSTNAQPELNEIAQQAYYKNNWFTPDNSLKALAAIADEFLQVDKLTGWIKQYPTEPRTPLTVGVVMAGNIPAVGFHDLLCVVLSGHQLLAKLSSQDFVLIHYLIQKLKEINPGFGSLLVEADRLNAADAYIATGSANTARYFDYYFAKKPHIIRKNRTSVGILMGEEGEEAFQKLGHDISDYYGLGCRNIATILVPEGRNAGHRNTSPEPYDFTPMLRALEPNATVYLNNHKYQNNYDYNKSIYLINALPHFDNGYLLVTENDGLVSPISVLYYQTYRTQAEAKAWIDERQDRIQVVASAQADPTSVGRGWYPGSVAFGQTQCPRLSDYADGVDTMAFLTSL